MIPLSPLAVLSIERNAWKDVELISRQTKNKPLHTFAVKRIKFYAHLMLDKGIDEMDADEDSDSREEENDAGEGIF